MKIAAAQINPCHLNIEANIQLHLKMIELATKQNVSLILFPEMSLTGYERELANDLSFSSDDSRLDILRSKSNEHHMHIVVGAPIQINNELYIGSFVISPNGQISIYTKQFLHAGEEKYFSPNSLFNPLIEIEGQKISIAICADITNPLHAENASKKETSLYLASFFYTPSGIEEGYLMLSDSAKKHQMNVLMANYIGSSYGLEAAGMSAYWDKNGELVSNLSRNDEALLIIEI